MINISQLAGILSYTHPVPDLTLSAVSTTGTVGTPGSATITNDGIVSCAWTASLTNSGTITPSSGTLGAGASVTVALGYVAAATHTLTVVNGNGGAVAGNNASIVVSPAPATSQTLSGTSSGATGTTYTATVTLNGAVPVGGGTTTITGAGATLSTTTLTWTQGGATSQTFTYSRSSDGTTTLSITNNMGLSNLGGFSFTSSTGAFIFDFTTMLTQDPLSVGGTWTNNTQGTGGNVAMNAQSSMRVIAAASGGINMAGGDANGQSAPFDYLDSFAFLPGFAGNQRITAVMYVQPGYTPASNHELELLLGCSSVSGSRRWISCTWNRDGSRIMALMDGPANGYTIFTPADNGSATALVDGDVWMAEFNRATNTVTTYINGVENLRSLPGNASSVAMATGNGIGIGSFRRTAEGFSAANAYGFRSVTFETF